MSYEKLRSTTGSKNPNYTQSERNLPGSQGNTQQEGKCVWDACTQTLCPAPTTKWQPPSSSTRLNADAAVALKPPQASWTQQASRAQQSLRRRAGQQASDSPAGRERAPLSRGWLLNTSPTKRKAAGLSYRGRREHQNRQRDGGAGLKGSCRPRLNKRSSKQGAAEAAPEPSLMADGQAGAGRLYTESSWSTQEKRRRQRNTNHLRQRCCVTSVVADSVTPGTAAHQAPLFMGLSQQEYCGALPFPSQGDPHDPGIKPESLTSPAVAEGFFTTSATASPAVSLTRVYTGFSTGGSR